MIAGMSNKWTSVLNAQENNMGNAVKPAKRDGSPLVILDYQRISSQEQARKTRN